jgi:hypothetical protein
MPPDTGPHNLLLHAASVARRPQLARQLQHISFEASHQFWSPDKPIPFAVFPLRGIVSLHLSPAPGRLVEVGLVGREGFAGAPLLLGSQDAQMIPLALTRGEAILMRPEIFRDYLRSVVFKTAVEHYVQFFMAMLAQFSLCNRAHSIEKLWVDHLLLIQDRLQTDSFQITQDLLGRVMGVRRASLNHVAVALRREGIIEYDRRGLLTIRNRRQLEDRACSCYPVMKGRFDRLIQTLG